MTNKEIFQEKMDALADEINIKAETFGKKTIDELTETVRNIKPGSIVSARVIRLDATEILGNYYDCDIPLPEGETMEGIAEDIEKGVLITVEVGYPTLDNPNGIHWFFLPISFSYSSYGEERISGINFVNVTNATAPSTQTPSEYNFCNFSAQLQHAGGAQSAPIVFQVRKKDYNVPNIIPEYLTVDNQKWLTDLVIKGAKYYTLSPNNLKTINNESLVGEGNINLADNNYIIIADPTDTGENNYKIRDEYTWEEIENAITNEKVILLYLSDISIYLTIDKIRYTSSDKIYTIDFSASGLSFDNKSLFNMGETITYSVSLINSQTTFGVLKYEYTNVLQIIGSYNTSTKVFTWNQPYSESSVILRYGSGLSSGLYGVLIDGTLYRFISESSTYGEYAISWEAIPIQPISTTPYSSNGHIDINNSTFTLGRTTGNQFKCEYHNNRIKFSLYDQSRLELKLESGSTTKYYDINQPYQTYYSSQQGVSGYLNSLTYNNKKYVIHHNTYNTPLTYENIKHMLDNQSPNFTVSLDRMHYMLQSQIDSYLSSYDDLANFVEHGGVLLKLGTTVIKCVLGGSGSGSDSGSGSGSGSGDENYRWVLETVNGDIIEVGYATPYNLFVEEQSTTTFSNIFPDWFANTEVAQASILDNPIPLDIAFLAFGGKFDLYSYDYHTGWCSSVDVD